MIGLSKPKTWNEYPLGEVAVIERASVTAHNIKSGTQYVGLEHLDGEGRILAVQTVNNGDLASNKFSFGPKHILYGKLRPYLRKIVRPDFNGVCSTDILPISATKIDRGYLFHYLRHPRVVEYATGRCEGANLPRISPSELEKFPVQFPSSLPEQRRIADILDKADAIRRKRQEAKDASDCFALSLFNYAFVNNYRHTNQQKSLVEIAEVVSGVTKGRRFNGAATRVVPYLRVANVQDGFLELSEIKTIEALTAEVPKLALQQGDVVMTEGGDFDKLGRGALWEHNVPDCIHQNHVFRVRVNRRFLLPEYFNVFLRTTRAKSYFLSCAKKTSNLASINITQLKALPVPLPKIALQEIFVRELRKSQQYKTNIKAHTDEVNNLFNSLVQRAFRGEL